MQNAKCKLHIAFACVFALYSYPVAVARTFSFDDIQFWVGTGANRAALVIDWNEDSTEPPALAWGYRWDGVASGGDMLAAVVAADPRLFARLRGTPTDPAAVFGLGYDANNDGQFALDDNTVFDAAGIAFASEAIDGVATTDSGDFYSEGWLAGFWHYGVASANPFDGSEWSDSLLGMASRTLTEGAWDSWTFESPISFTAYAENPVSAIPSLSTADFNHDGGVDSADYDLWQNTFGSMSKRTADGNGNGIVDAADYVLWRDRFADAVPALVAASAAGVPEPPTVSSCALAVFLVIGKFARTLRERR
jgi:hypothetical protein